MKFSQITCLITAAILIAAFIGCQESNQLPTAQKLYSSKCSSCHRLIPPEKHTPAEWKLYIDRYGKKLTNDQKNALLTHLSK